MADETQMAEHIGNNDQEQPDDTQPTEEEKNNPSGEQTEKSSDEMAEELKNIKIKYQRVSEKEEEMEKAMKILNPKNGICCNRDVKLRLSRWCFMSFVPMIFLAILTNTARKDGSYSISLSFYVGFALETMYIAYFSMVGYLFWSGHKKDIGNNQKAHLFRILTKTGTVNGWAKMNIAGDQYQYHYTAIQSISEFSAIDGGVASIMLANLGPFTWAVTVMNFAAQIQCFDDFSWDIADLCEIVGVTGLVMIGLFELDPNNKPMKIFHYLGALAGSGTVLGFVIQGASLADSYGNGDSDSSSSSSSTSGGFADASNYYDSNYYDSDYDSDGGSSGGAGFLVLPILIALICTTLFIGWQCGFNKCTDRYQKRIDEEVNDVIVKKYAKLIDDKYSGQGSELLKDLDKDLDRDHKIEEFLPKERKEAIKDDISCYSLKNVISEAIFLFCGATALCIYLMQYDLGCCRGCSHQGANYCD